MAAPSSSTLSGSCLSHCLFDIWSVLVWWLWQSEPNAMGSAHGYKIKSGVWSNISISISKWDFNEISHKWFGLSCVKSCRKATMPRSDALKKLPQNLKRLEELQGGSRYSYFQATLMNGMLNSCFWLNSDLEALTGLFSRLQNLWNRSNLTITREMFKIVSPVAKEKKRFLYIADAFIHFSNSSLGMRLLQ